MNVTKQIYSTEGLPGFMRGLVPSMVKNTLTAGSYFSMLYYFEETLKRMQIFQNQAQLNSLASMLARIAQTTISNPIIIIKTRFEVTGFNEYSGIFDATRKIYYQEGFGGFFTGLRVSLIRDVPMSGVYYPIYTFLK